jgi:hypothetical protein
MTMVTHDAVLKEILELDKKLGVVQEENDQYNLSFGIPPESPMAGHASTAAAMFLTYLAARMFEVQMGPTGPGPSHDNSRAIVSARKAIEVTYAALQRTIKNTVVGTTKAPPSDSKPMPRQVVAGPITQLQAVISSSIQAKEGPATLPKPSIFYVVNTPADGTCFFHAMYHLLKHSGLWEKVKAAIHEKDEKAQLIDADQGHAVRKATGYLLRHITTECIREFFNDVTNYLEDQIDDEDDPMDILNKVLIDLAPKHGIQYTTNTIVYNTLLNKLGKETAILLIYEKYIEVLLRGNTELFANVIEHRIWNTYLRTEWKCELSVIPNSQCTPEKERCITSVNNTDERMAIPSPDEKNPQDYQMLIRHTGNHYEWVYGMDEENNLSTTVFNKVDLNEVVIRPIDKRPKFARLNVRDIPLNSALWASYPFVSDGQTGGRRRRKLAR